MKKILLCLFLWPYSLLAQINESDTVKFKANLSLTNAWQEGNVEVLTFRGKTEFSIKMAKSWVFKSQNAYLYQEFFNRKADEDLYSRNFVYFSPDKRVYPFALGFASTNFRLKIDLRYFAGLGATWQIIRKKNHLLKLAVSGEYEATQFAQNNFNENQYDGNAQIRTWRATAWLFGRHHCFRNKLILSYEAYLQPSLEQSNNLRWQAELNADLPIWKFLSFRVNYLYIFESVVIEGQRQNDRIFTSGINLKI